jgi:hypothetical protein
MLTPVSLSLLQDGPGGAGVRYCISAVCHCSAVISPPVPKPSHSHSLGYNRYEEHLSSVNAVCFIDDGRSFVSSADDKKLMIWEFGIPVVKKPISEPHMHSMPYLAETNPDGEFFLAQSMDNQVLRLSSRTAAAAAAASSPPASASRRLTVCLTVRFTVLHQIVTYSAKEGSRYRLNSKKRFGGHSNSGYACALGTSPDGKYVYSGDGNGKLFFWEWKSTRIVKVSEVACAAELLRGQTSLGAPYIWYPIYSTLYIVHPKGSAVVKEFQHGMAGEEDSGDVGCCGALDTQPASPPLSYRVYYI